MAVIYPLRQHQIAAANSASGYIMHEMERMKLDE